MAPRAKITEKTGGRYFAAPKTELKFISSGSTLLNLALGGGWVRRRVSNIVGDKSTGKTLLCIEACANFAREEKKAKIRYRETESAFDQSYAKALGMPIDRIDFGEPMLTVEALFKDLEKVIDGAKGPEFLVLDSLDALSDEAELEREFDAGSFGAAKAKKLSELFRRLISRMESKDVTLMIVSQVRDDINARFGRKVKRTGGRALDFYASQVVYLAHVGRLTQTIHGQKRVTGVKVKAQIDKNKVGLPFREAEFRIRFGYGVNDAQSMVDWLKLTKTKGVGINDADAKEYLDVLLDQSVEDEHAEIERLRELCGKRWYDMESELLPTRSKYGV